MTYSNLNEGLKIGDLNDLCLSTISIDQFESKFGDNCIVVAFYVLYKNPAVDLNNFIQKSVTKVLDTNVSPAPTEDGYYVVFVEFKRDSNFADNIIYLCDTLVGLTGNQKWEFRSHINKNCNDLNHTNLIKYIDGIKSNKEKISEYFKDSNLDDLILENNNIIFCKSNFKQKYEFVGFGSSNAIFEKYNLVGQKILLDESASLTTSKIRYYLGYNWCIDILKEYILITKSGQDKSVIIKPC